MLRNTHRHPANIALHVGGATCYLLAAVSFTGSLAIYYDDILPVNGAIFMPAGIAMFICGHAIEGNLRSITPVLGFRLISLKVRRYLAAKRVHFLRT